VQKNEEKLAKRCASGLRLTRGGVVVEGERGRIVSSTSSISGRSDTQPENTKTHGTLMTRVSTRKLFPEILRPLRRGENAQIPCRGGAGKFIISPGKNSGRLSVRCRLAGIRRKGRSVVSFLGPEETSSTAFIWKGVFSNIRTGEGIAGRQAHRIRSTAPKLATVLSGPSYWTPAISRRRGEVVWTRGGN